ncbi:FMN-linked oxidoreductase [Stereum hirsutum FP-91666 SS1]|uniref:FMN-linked oxidoreductase n=1 Tax=Stereum hirsutum (strain FP-91666) TaxID=721885 RepID=R7RXI4_STEHR|nr:FMN-linked oxidoreductase [Stereum hirsutum FP-91666 SS1]EIM80039.1 FMN-linked oxidoreductase [Stereum hirsutum FP-91666 SS1]
MSNLFSPIKIGDITLSHRVALAALGRFRSDASHVHSSGHGFTYYTQRATPGGLLITEATPVHPRAGGYAHNSAITTEAQIAAWKKIVDGVHAKGGFIFMQIWAMGRAARPDILKAQDPSWDVVSASPLYYPETDTMPRELTIPEIREFVAYHAEAAHNAVHLAGFDGVEIHAGNGYLIDSFLKDVSNWRTDEYGGSIEARCRFALEVIDAIVKEVGEKRTGIRLSPFFKGNQMDIPDPVPTFSHLVSRIGSLHPNLAYIHSTEPRVDGTYGVVDDFQTLAPDVGSGNNFIRELWGERPFLVDGGFKADTALLDAEKHPWDVVAFGRMFLANPDLPRRIKEGIELNVYDRSTFYTPETPVGYIDYPFAEEVQAKRQPSQTEI